MTGVITVEPSHFTDTDTAYQFHTYTWLQVLTDADTDRAYPFHNDTDTCLQILTDTDTIGIVRFGVPILYCKGLAELWLKPGNTNTINFYQYYPYPYFYR